MYHIEGKSIEFDKIHDARVKKLFREVQAALEAQLGSKRCPTHDREPRIGLFCKDGEFAGYGSGVCCEEFAQGIGPLMNVPLPGVGFSKRETMIRVMKYSEMG